MAAAAAFSSSSPNGPSSDSQGVQGWSHQPDRPPLARSSAVGQPVRPPPRATAELEVTALSIWGR